VDVPAVGESQVPPEVSLLDAASGEEEGHAVADEADEAIEGTFSFMRDLYLKIAGSRDDLNSRTWSNPSLVVASILFCYVASALLTGLT